jgi:hypothetical protein
MRTTAEKVLADDDGTSHTWSVQQFPATEGLRVFARLLQLIGPAAGQALAALKGGRGLMDAEVNSDALGAAVAALAARLDEDTVIGLVQRLLKEVRKDGREVLPVFDIEFMGQYGKLVQVLRLVLEHNFRDFWNAAALAQQGKSLGAAA